MSKVRHLKKDIRTISPGWNCPTVRVRAWVRFRVSFRVVGQFSLRGIVPEPWKNIHALNWKCQIAVLLRCCWPKCVHHKIKNYLWWMSHQYHCKMWKKPAEECSFLRSYLVATCSFAKSKTPSQVIFHGLQFD